MCNDTAAAFKVITTHRPRNAGGWVTVVTLPRDETEYFLAVPTYAHPAEVLAYQAPSGTVIQTRRGKFTKLATGNWDSQTSERDMTVSAQTLFHVIMTEFLGTV